MSSYLSQVKETHAYKYADDVLQERIISGKYIKLACERFMEDVSGDTGYFLDIGELQLIENITKLLNFSTGMNVNQPIYDGLAGFQWFFITNALCIKHISRPTKRKYEKSVLLIARKNGKSFLVALMFIIMLLTEDRYSELYSVAPDKDLSSIIKKEIEQMLDMAHPSITEKFHITRDKVTCTMTQSSFIPLAHSEDRMDGRHANVFVADEVGALRTNYPIESMQSSQMNMENRTGILISTAYESMDNPMIEEVENAQEILDKVDGAKDDTLFAMIYRPDNESEWMEDEAIYQANPLVYDVPDNLEYLLNQRNRALRMESVRTNFLTKHLNIFTDGVEVDRFIDVQDLIKGRLVDDDQTEWYGREVYLGVDLSQSMDTTSVSMIAYDNENDVFLSKSWAFLPEQDLEERNHSERMRGGMQYQNLEKGGYCFIVGDRVVDYRFIEKFVLNIEYKYGVIVKGIGYDKWNASALVNKWDYEGYQTIEIRQHSSALHPATKLLKERILEGEFFYDRNPLYERHFSNARQTEDTNLNIYVNKKRSSGRIDMVVSTINAMFLWNEELYVDGGNPYDYKGLEIL